MEDFELLSPAALDPAPRPQDLDAWPVLAAEQVAFGTPVRRGRYTWRGPDQGLSVGTVHSTAYRSRPFTYPVDEVLVILNGHVELQVDGGPLLQVGAGQTLFISKGTRCVWNQTHDVLRHFLRLDDLNDSGVHDPARGAVTIDANTALQPFPGPAADILIGPVPTCAAATVYEAPSGRLKLMVWSATPYARHPAPHAMGELMVALKGDFSLVGPNECSVRVSPGQAVFVPQGARVAWLNDEPVVKLACFIR